MRPLPPMVRDQLLESTLGNRRFAYVQIDPEGRVILGGGELGWFGLENLAPGEWLVERTDFIEGFLPMGSEPELLPRLEVTPGRFADVHLGPADGGIFVLLIDATSDAIHEGILQANTHELNLLKRSIGKASGPAFPAGPVAAERRSLLRSIFGPEGTRLTSTVLRIALPTMFPAAFQPKQRIQLRRSRQQLIQELLVERGAVTELQGLEGLQACFGLLPSRIEPAVEALGAVEQVLRVVDSAVQFRSEGGDRLCAGLATGEVDVGWSGDSENARLAVAGAPVERAPGLAWHARPGEILVDAATVGQVSKDSSGDFVPYDAQPWGTSSKAEKQVFLYRPKA